jgi:hypothetical protein
MKGIGRSASSKAHYTRIATLLLIDKLKGRNLESHQTGLHMSFTR